MRIKAGRYTWACVVSAICGLSGDVIAEGFVYWGDVGTRPLSVRRVGADGSNPLTVVEDARLGLALDPANGYVYYIDENGDGVRRAGINDGNNPEDLVSLPTSANLVNLALDVPNNSIYWADFDQDVIQRSDLDGGNVMDVIHTGGEPVDLALDLASGHVYWREAQGQLIRRANLDGSDPVDLVVLNDDGNQSGIGLDLVNGHIYWTDNSFDSGDKIYRADLDGGNVIEAITGLETPRDVAVDPDNGHLYWTERGDGITIFARIARANLDGTNVVDIVNEGADLDSPFFLELTAETPEPAAAMLLVIGGLPWVLTRRRRRQMASR